MRRCFADEYRVKLRLEELACFAELTPAVYVTVVLNRHCLCLSGEYSCYSCENLAVVNVLCFTGVYVNCVIVI